MVGAIVITIKQKIKDSFFFLTASPSTGRVCHKIIGVITQSEDRGNSKEGN